MKRIKERNNELWLNAVGYLILGVLCGVDAAAESQGSSAAPEQPARAGAELAVENLPAMTVTGAGERGYTVLDATTATKTDVPLMETPVSIRVIPRAVLDDQQAFSIRDGLKFIAGVNPGYSSEGITNQAFTLRGFSTQVGTVGGVYYREGMRLQRIPTSVASLERIELLKGPATVLYGRAQPGGIINLVPKNPLSFPYYSLQQQFGSYDFYRTSADATGPITKDGNLSYRLNLEYLDTNSFRDHIFEDFFAIAPTLSWQIGDRTEFEIEFQYTKKNFITDQGIPALGDRPAPIPISRFLGDTLSGRENDTYLVDVDLTHELLPDWQVRLKTTFAHENDKGLDVFPIALDEATGELSRMTFGQDIGRHFFFTSLNLIGHAHLLDMEHTLLVGADYYDQKSEATIGFFDAPSVDIFSPTASLAIRPAFPSGGFPFESLSKWYGIYLQDQIAITEQWYFLGGFRYDNATSSNGIPPAKELGSDAVNPRVGLVYQPRAWVSLYGSYGESFGTNNGFSLSGTPFQPEKAKQYEFGIKTEFFNGGLIATMAYYNLTKSNILTRNPINPMEQIAVGEANSTGFEFDVSGQITEKLGVIGSYAYTDTEITKDNSANENNRLPNVPEHAGSFWAKYDLTTQLSIGTGMFAAGEREVDNANTAQMPGYVRLDAMVAYRWRLAGSRITAQLNLQNLLDKKYYLASNLVREQILPGAPLTVLGSVRIEY